MEYIVTEINSYTFCKAKVQFLWATVKRLGMPSHIFGTFSTFCWNNLYILGYMWIYGHCMELLKIRTLHVTTMMLINYMTNLHLYSLYRCMGSMWTYGSIWMHGAVWMYGTYGHMEAYRCMGVYGNMEMYGLGELWGHMDV